MEDAADLGLSALEYGIDKYHDKVYDSASRVPTKLKTVTKRSTKQDSQGDPVVVEQKQTVEVEDKDPRRRNPQSGRPSQAQQRYQPSSRYQPPQEFDRYPRSRRMSDVYGSDAGYSRGGGRSTRGIDRDTYEPEQAGMRGYAGRDGYAPYTPNYAGAAYDAAERGEGPRYLEYERNGSGYDDRRRSYDDERSRRGGGGWDEDEEEDERSRGGELTRRRGSQSRKSSRSRGGDSRPGSSRGGEHNKQGDELKKWGATLAGAAVGAYGGRVATNKKGAKDNWVPAAIGAVVGGLIAREAEKEFTKRKEHKEQQREEEEDSYESHHGRERW